MKTFLFCIFILFSSIVRGNDTIFGGDASNIFPMESTQIQMVKEKVGLCPTTDGFWKTEAVFWFKNLSDKTVDVQIGFPDWQMTEADDAGNEKTRWAILAFVSKVDGKKVQTEHKAVTGGDYQGAYLWRVSFKPHEEKKLESSYIFGGFQQSAMFGEALRKSAGAAKGNDWWQASPDTKAAKELEQSPFQKIIYILKTGKNWAGQIEDAEIVLELPPNQNPLTVSALPIGYIYANNKLTWHFKNFKPTQDIAVFLAAPFDKKIPIVVETPQQEHSWKNLAAKNNVDKFTLDIARNSPFAAQGRIFQREDLRKFFSAQSWYVPSVEKECAPRFSDYPVAEIFKGPLAAIDFKSAPKDSVLNPVQFKTRLTEGIKEGPNFAGHYTVISWGCGTSCQINAIVDGQTGKIITMNLETQLGVDFRKNSNLLVANPMDPSILNRQVGDKIIPVSYYKMGQNMLVTLCQPAQN